MSADVPGNSDDRAGSAAAERSGPLGYNWRLLLGIAVFLLLLVAEVLIGTQLGREAAVLAITCSLLCAAILYRNARAALLFLAALVFFIGSMSIPCAPHGGRRGKTPQCADTMRSIAQALTQYAESRGHYPPAVIRDREGRPLYSWRVEILPFLDRADLYAQFHPDEPWDTPHNKGLLKECNMFHCPSDPTPPEMTSYVAVVGEQAMLDASLPRANDDCADGPGNTLLLVECSRSGVAWSEPVDVYLDTMPLSINTPIGIAMRSDHVQGCNVAFADTHIEYFAEGISPVNLRAFLTRNGGEWHSQ